MKKNIINLLFPANVINLIWRSSSTWATLRDSHRTGWCKLPWPPCNWYTTACCAANVRLPLCTFCTFNCAAWTSWRRDSVRGWNRKVWPQGYCLVPSPFPMLFHPWHQYRNHNENNPQAKEHDSKTQVCIILQPLLWGYCPRVGANFFVFIVGIIYKPCKSTFLSSCQMSFSSPQACKISQLYLISASTMSKGSWVNQADIRWKNNT